MRRTRIEWRCHPWERVDLEELVGHTDFGRPWDSTAGIPDSELDHLRVSETELRRAFATSHLHCW